MRRTLKSFFLIINYKTLIVTALSCASTYYCYRHELLADFPVILVSVAIVFPVVFSIDSAYKRRENALKHLADFKGHAIAIYIAMKDWTTTKDNDLPKRTKVLIEEMLTTIRRMFREGRDQERTHEVEIYRMFSTLSGYTQELRNYGVQSGEISRISQYVSKLVIAFDNMKMVHRYRTPITLRAYSKVFIYIFPIIYGPYFANTVKSYSHTLEYVMPVLYSFILVSLDNIQDHLEHPFDEVGEDDIKIEVDEIVALLN